MKIKKGDNIIVTTGRDAGKEGKVLRVFPKTNKILAEKINLLKRRIRPKKTGEKGQVVSVAYPLDVSKVLIKCARCGRGVRVAHRVVDKEKIRVCRKCEQAL